MKRLILYGVGEPAGVRLALKVNEAEHRWEEIVLIDEHPGECDSVLGVSVIGGMKKLEEIEPESEEVQCLLADSPLERWRIRARLARYGLPFATLIHPAIDIAGARLMGDVVVHEHATLAPETLLDAGCLVQTGAVVGHEAHVGRGCVLGSGSVLNARVVLAHGVELGINSVVIPEQHVGAWATIGAGSVVVEDVPEGAFVFGVPGRVVRVDPLPELDSVHEAIDGLIAAAAPDAKEEGRPQVAESSR